MKYDLELDKHQEWLDCHREDIDRVCQYKDEVISLRDDLVKVEMEISNMKDHMCHCGDLVCVWFDLSWCLIDCLLGILSCLSWPSWKQPWWWRVRAQVCCVVHISYPSSRRRRSCVCGGNWTTPVRCYVLSSFFLGWGRTSLRGRDQGWGDKSGRRSVTHCYLHYWYPSLVH